MIQTILVFLGGGLGAAARHGVNVGAARLLGLTFPWGTLTVNVVGSALMGLITGWLAFRGDAGTSQHLRLLITTGFLGGFTTFSAFSLDTVLLWERDQHWLAVGYVAISVALALAGLVAGLWVVRSLS